MIHNMAGGGAGLNLKVIGGAKPITGDTLTWDCDTTGLTIVGSFALVSEYTPTLIDMSNGGTIYLYAGGVVAQTMEVTAAEVASDVLFVSQSGFVVLQDGASYGGMTFPKAGTYLPTNSGAECIVIQINGYTGFGGTIAKENTIWVDNGSDTLLFDGYSNNTIYFNNSLYWANDAVLTSADMTDFSVTLKKYSDGTEQVLSQADFTVRSYQGGFALTIGDQYYLFSGYEADTGVPTGTWLGAVDDFEWYVASVTVQGFTFYIPINGYAFSATEPTSPVEGMVWFQTGAASAAAMNIDKKNTVMLYPVACKQYISSAWVSKTAMTYINGAWEDWMLYLYQAGDINTGFVGIGWKPANGGYAKAPKITYNADSVVFTATTDQYGGTGCVAHFPDMVDLTEYTTLTADATLAGSIHANNRPEGLYIWSAIGNSTYPTAAVASATFGATGDKILTIDVSRLSGEYYIGFGLRYESTPAETITVREVRLE